MYHQNVISKEIFSFVVTLFIILCIGYTQLIVIGNKWLVATDTIISIFLTKCS